MPTRLTITTWCRRAICGIWHYGVRVYGFGVRPCWWVCLYGWLATMTATKQQRRPMHRAVNNEQRLVPHHGILSLSFDQKPKTQPKPTNPRPETRTPEQIRSCLGCRTNKSSSSVLLLLLQQQQHQLQIETYSTATDQVNQVSGAVSRSYSIRHTTTTSIPIPKRSCQQYKLVPIPTTQPSWIGALAKCQTR